MGARFNLVSQEKMLEEGKHVPDEARAIETEKKADGAEGEKQKEVVAKEDDFVNVP